MTRIIFSIAAALFLLAGPAQAGDDRYRRSDSKDRLVRSAVQLESETQALYDHVANRARRGSRNARRILPALRTLDQRADRFHAQVLRHGDSPRKLDRSHAKLVRAFRDARACAADLEMHRLMGKLDRRVGHRVTRLDRQIEQVRVARYERNRPRRQAERSRDRDRDRDRWEVARRWPAQFGWWLDHRR